MFIALYLVPLPWRAFLSKSPTNQRTRNPLLSMNMPSIQIRGHAKTHRPILWENEKESRAGFQRANTEYIEAEIVIVVSVPLQTTA